MPTVNVTADVTAPPEKTWEVLSDPNRYADWLTLHDGWTVDPPAEVGVGTALHERVKLMGMVNKIDWTVQDYQAPSTMTIAGKGMAGVQVSFTLSVAPSGEGSTVTIDAEFTGQMIVGALGTAVTKDAKKNLDRSLVELSELVG